MQAFAVVRRSGQGVPLTPEGTSITAPSRISTWLSHVSKDSLLSHFCWMLNGSEFSRALGPISGGETMYEHIHNLITQNGLCNVAGVYTIKLTPIKIGHRSFTTIDSFPAQAQLDNSLDSS